MGMNPLDFLNKFLSEANYGLKGVKQEWKEAYDNHLGINKYNDLNPYDRTVAEISSATIGSQEPQWLKSVARTRSSSDYQNWLLNSNEFELGGAKYKWMEEDSPAIMQSNVNGLRGKSNSDIAAHYAKTNHRDNGQYQGSYLNFINEKQRLTGKRYIPVRIG